MSWTGHALHEWFRDSEKERENILQSPHVITTKMEPRPPTKPLCLLHQCEKENIHFSRVRKV